MLNLVCLLSKDNIPDMPTFKYLYDPYERKVIPHLYLLPKIHKIKDCLGNLDPANPENVSDIRIPGRPIISQCNSPTEKLSRCLDYFLLPIVKSQSTYISDTSDFINAIERLTIPRGSILVTYDTTSLYTNLGFEEITEALRLELETNNDIEYEIRKPTTGRLLEITDLILRNNEFSFNGKFYRQIVGAPHGAVPSPELCDIAIYRHIGKLISQFVHKQHIIGHWRFRDDGFIIFDGSKHICWISSLWPTMLTLC